MLNAKSLEKLWKLLIFLVVFSHSLKCIHYTTSACVLRITASFYGCIEFYVKPNHTSYNLATIIAVVKGVKYGKSLKQYSNVVFEWPFGSVRQDVSLKIVNILRKQESYLTCACVCLNKWGVNVKNLNNFQNQLLKSLL